MVKTRLLVWCVLVALALGHGLAQAARSFSIVQTPSAATAIFNMGTTQSLSYLISNTNTGTNTGERIYQVQFVLPTGGSLFSSTTAAPAGWTRSAFSSTSVTFKASSWANAIATGGSTSFALVLAMTPTTADVTQTLASISSSYTKSTTLRLTKKVTTNGPGSWTRKSLAITSFQITDLSGVPLAGLVAGGSFRLVMTVQNNSSVTQSGIVSSPNPPSAVKTGTVTQSLTGTAGSPLTLAAGASGTITFTFSTVGPIVGPPPIPGDNGTIYFTAFARASASITSTTATSPTLTVASCILAANFQLPASSVCQYPGSNITLRLALTNNCSSTLTTVTPSLSTTGPAALVSGPTPATIASIAVGATTTVDWVYQINNSAATNPFTFSGSATSLSPAVTAPAATSATITRGGFPTIVTPVITNASSTNVQLTWTPTNNGCAAVNSVAVTFPAGWVWANDAYSLVDLSAINSVETWVASGTNPVTFTSPNVASQLPLSFSGDFSLVFSATPASAVTSTFIVNVTDANGLTVPVSVPVTVNPFDPAGLNNVTNGIRIWREQFP